MENGKLTLLSYVFEKQDLFFRNEEKDKKALTSLMNIVKFNNFDI